MKLLSKFVNMKKMKFTLLILSFLTLSGCKKADTDTNPNPKAQNVDYEFTITINGVIHKVKGNTVNGEPTIFGNWYTTTDNKCYYDIGYVLLETNDVSEFNYVSGKVLGCTISFHNLALGVSNATLRFYGGGQGGYWTNLTDSLDVDDIYGFSTTRGEYIGNGSTIPINITDIGNGPTIITNVPLVYNHTKTFKGNFNGILYMVRKKTWKYDIPINISIDFKAVRVN